MIRNKFRFVGHLYLVTDNAANIKKAFHDVREAASRKNSPIRSRSCIICIQLRYVAAILCILGQSLAKHLTMQLPEHDSSLNLAEGGNTWAREERHVCSHIKEWEAAILESGTSPKIHIFEWMWSKDAYDRPGMFPQGFDRGTNYKGDLKTVDVMGANNHGGTNQ